MAEKKLRGKKRLPRQKSLFPSPPSGLQFNNFLAGKVFHTLARMWQGRDGIFSGLQAPQQRDVPKELREETRAQELCQYLFFQALSMRGGVNSDDAFHLTAELWNMHPELFCPSKAMTTEEKAFIAAVKEAAAKMHPLLSEKGKRAGAYSYLLGEHARHWRENAAALVKHFDGDIRTAYHGISSFEESFGRVEKKFKGMRRKIFALLTMWLQEFSLIEGFPLPVIVDFHCLRFLAQQRIITVKMKPLGPGKSTRPERQRARALQKLPALHVTEALINTVMSWSEGFLKTCGLSSYDVSHALWFLSRELCASYYGNRSFARQLGPRRSITARIVPDKELKTISGWPKTYKDLCRYCPFENTCKMRIPAGPYFDFGRLVNAGRHIVYPGRSLPLDPQWLPELPVAGKSPSSVRQKPPPDKVTNSRQGFLFAPPS